MRTFRKSYRRISKFVKVAFLVGLHICLSGVEKAGRCRWRLLSIAWQLVTGIPPSRAKREEFAPFYIARLRVCRVCPLYNRRLGTCGTPGTVTQNPATGERTQVGCWCFLAAKSQAPESTCWAWDHKIEGIGWPDRLNNVTVL